jgi:hypothetical protein
MSGVGHHRRRSAGLGALALGALLTSTFAATPADAASPNAQQVAAAAAPVVVKAKGEVYFDRSVALGRNDGGTVKLSAKPDGTGGILVDDAIAITVTRPDGAQTSVSHAFNDQKCTVLTSTPPIDLSSAVPAGNSVVRVQLKDVCGGKERPITSLWLVVNGQPTLLRASPAVAAALPATPELATVYVPNLSAKLTEAATFNPVPGRLVTFRAGSSVICSALTDSDGVATCGGLAEFLTAVLNLGYTGDFAGDPSYTASAVHGSLLTIGTTALPD